MDYLTRIGSTVYAFRVCREVQGQAGCQGPVFRLRVKGAREVVFERVFDWELRQLKPKIDRRLGERGAVVGTAGYDLQDYLRFVGREPRASADPTERFPSHVIARPPFSWLSANLAR